jgi:hypothetical protein
MMKWLPWVIVGAMLSAVLVLAFVYPHEMVSPGNLRPAHASLERDCFACHLPFRGSSAARCITCHKVADIGLRTTKGKAITPTPGHPAFHQALIEKDCMACHSDHPRPLLTRTAAKSFNHTLLAPNMRGRCETCHIAPKDDQHNGIKLPCAECHQVSGWRPATFDHDRYFLLDGDHNTTCVTCHTGQNYRRYTCYGCHEHQPDRIIAKHKKEGIRDIDNCVRCHRSAEGDVEEHNKDGGDKGDD